VAAKIEAVLVDRENLKKEISQSREIAEKADNYGITAIDSDLEGAVLIDKIRKLRIRFGSPFSAAYHAAKHWAHEPEAYVNNANNHIGSVDSICEIHPTQEGDALDISF